MRCVGLLYTYSSLDHRLCDTRALVILILSLYYIQQEGTIWRKGTKASIACLFVLLQCRQDKMLEIFFPWKILVLSFLCTFRSSCGYYRGEAISILFIADKIEWLKKRKTGIFISVVIFMVVTIRGIIKYGFHCICITKIIFSNFSFPCLQTCIFIYIL